MPSRFEIDDQLWAEIQPLLPPRSRRRRYPGRPPFVPRSTSGALDQSLLDGEQIGG